MIIIIRSFSQFFNKSALGIRYLLHLMEAKFFNIWDRNVAGSIPLTIQQHIHFKQLFKELFFFFIIVSIWSNVILLVSVSLSLLLHLQFNFNLFLYLISAMFLRQFYSTTIILQQLFLLLDNLINHKLTLKYQITFDIHKAFLTNEFLTLSLS